MKATKKKERQKGAERRVCHPCNTADSQPQQVAHILLSLAVICALCMPKRLAKSHRNSTCSIFTHASQNNYATQLVEEKKKKARKQKYLENKIISCDRWRADAGQATTEQWRRSVAQ
jgi:hypothetical protein